MVYYRQNVQYTHHNITIQLSTASISPKRIYYWDILCLIRGEIGKQALYNCLMQKESPPHENPFSIEFDEWTTLQSLLTRYSGASLTNSFWKRHERELAQFVFAFRITYEGEKWKLRRAFPELLSFEKAMIKRYDKDIPHFPMQKENEITIDTIDKLSEFLIFFLKKVVNTAFFDPEVQAFLDILPEKFGHGVIFGEFQLRKLSGGRYNQKSYCKSLRHCLCPCARTWRTRFFTVTDNGVFYSKVRRSFEVRDMLIYCNRFKMFIGKQETEDELGVTLKSSQRELALVAPDISTFVLFVTAMREALENSPLTKEHPFGSFSPVRKNCSTVFYADGEGYFRDVYLELKNAKKYVYITDWMITPYFNLVRKEGEEREASEVNQFRLDKVLEEAAGRGVAIYIILYQEPKVAINNDSQYAEKYLSRLHRNIKVIRHPNYLVIPFFWSHHQKLVLIDQRIAFIGGLDICYGRWDTPAHHLTNDHNLWSGADFCNLRITDIYFPRNFMMCSLDPRTQPRMPWHDVAIQLRGASVHDLARHFTGYWNFVTSQMDMDDQELLTISGRQTYHFHSSNSHEETRDNKVVPMMDRRKDTEDIESELVDNLIQEEYYEKYLNENVLRVGSLQIPRMHVIKENIKAMPRKLIELITQSKGENHCLLVSNQAEDTKEGRYSHQFLRSAATWSQGLMQKEQSIYEAYLHLIETAENFIYIENQFFICKENLIVEKLAQRISRAYASKKPFKVIVFIPLLPGFQGDVREEKSAVMRIQLHWEYWTICRSKKSLFSRLAHVKPLEQYLQFFSLRQHGSTHEKLPLTEILYIHSKLMIVDDMRMIIGSANINDRSLLGQRDSEIALYIQEQQPVASPFGWEVSPGIQDFRVRLYEEHFGNTGGLSANPLNEELWRMCQLRAKTNTLIYRDVFGCYPDDTIHSFAQIEEVYRKSRLENYEKRKQEIVGHVVQLPLRFLQQENLNLSAKEKEYFLPNIFFT